MSYVIRVATPADAAVIAGQRAAMFQDMGAVSGEDARLLRQACEPWLSTLLTRGEYAGWLVEDGTDVVAGGGAFIRELGPAPGRCRLGRWAHIANVYTEPAYRRRGLARRLMETILAWCDTNAIDQITLAASEEGRPLYESLGFKPKSDLQLR